MGDTNDFREIIITTDELTGLLDKQAFLECAQNLLDSANEEIEYAFIFFDLENFKIYNVNYGYELGDELLASIGYIIKDVFPGQLISRFSGDHFVVCATSVQIVPAINDIRRRVKLIQKSVNMEMKAGIYVFEGGEDHDVVRCCDRARMACVSIKRQYDISFKFYDEDLGGSIRRKQEILDSLDEAIEKKYIKVYYQPIVRTLTGDVCSWEALVRWIDPNKGMVFPNEFIPVLEEYHLIPKVDAFVIEEVMSKYHTQVAHRMDAVPVSINLSRIDFEVFDVVSFIEQQVKKYRCPRNMFHFEITESALTKNARYIMDQVKKMRELGYSVWMDDFGSGYSSLNLLKNYEFDLVKIDMDFLSQFDESDNGKIILRHIVSMIKNLNVHTLAEGVENQEQYDFLKGIGCEMIQGYLIGRPMPYLESLDCVLKSGRKLESGQERFFENELGKVDLLRQNPLQNVENNDIENPLPLAVGVVEDSVWKVMYGNSGFKELIREFDFDSVKDVEDMLNNTNGRKWTRQEDFKELCVHSKETGSPVSLDFIGEGHIINLRIRYLCSDDTANKSAYLVSVRLLSRFLNSNNDNRINAISRSMLSMYECVDLYGIGNNYYENVFRNDSRLRLDYTGKKSKEVIRSIQEDIIYPDDRKFFADLMNLDTIADRLKEEPGGSIIGFIRVLSPRKIYIWKTISLSMMHFENYDAVMCCVSTAPNEIARRMNTASSMAKPEQFNEVSKYEAGSDTDAINILQLLPLGVFWKDKERRFKGANQMFLDYYGFQSVESIIGKTDEDMGWHIDPEPFKRDELDVIENGKVIENVHGECIVRGQVRYISANKRPFVVDREIVGLVGFFQDVTSELEQFEKMETLIKTDALTGLYNRRAFEEIVLKYEEQYHRNNTDFAFFLLDIDKFKQINDMYGHDIGDEVLKAASRVFSRVASENSVVFRYGGDEFVILHQYRNDAEIESIKQELDIGLSRLEWIGNVKLSIRASKGIVYYSDYESISVCLDEADKRMYEDKEVRQKKRNMNKNKS